MEPPISAPRVVEKSAKIENRPCQQQVSAGSVKRKKDFVFLSLNYCTSPPKGADLGEIQLPFLSPKRRFFGRIN